MRIASGEDDDFACFDGDRIVADDIREAATFGDHMIRDQMLGAGRSSVRSSLAVLVEAALPANADQVCLVADR